MSVLIVRNHSINVLHSICTYGFTPASNLINVRNAENAFHGKCSWSSIWGLIVVRSLINVQFAGNHLLIGVIWPYITDCIQVSPYLFKWNSIYAGYASYPISITFYTLLLPIYSLDGCSYFSYLYFYGNWLIIGSFPRYKAVYMSHLSESLHQETPPEDTFELPHRMQALCVSTSQL